MSSEQAAQEVADWRKVAAGYREILAGDLEKSEGRREAVKKTNHGRAARAPLGGARLTEAQLLRCRVRYFTDGLVLGSREFVDRAFHLTRERFGPRRKDGARKLARADTGLRSMRALRVDAYGTGDPLMTK